MGLRGLRFSVASAAIIAVAASGPAAPAAAQHTPDDPIAACKVERNEAARIACLEAAIQAMTAQRREPLQLADPVQPLLILQATAPGYVRAEVGFPRPAHRAVDVEQLAERLVPNQRDVIVPAWTSSA